MSKPMEDYVFRHTTCKACEERKENGLKLCLNCHEVKPVADFYRRSQRHHGVDPQCKACMADRARTRNAQERVKQQTRDRKYRALYGITTAEYEVRFERQGGACAICRQPATAALHVDHDHTTKAVRDLLCRVCNVLLGNCRDDPAILKAAIEYLERHSHVVQGKS